MSIAKRIVRVVIAIPMSPMFVGCPGDPPQAPFGVLAANMTHALRKAETKHCQRTRKHDWPVVRVYPSVRALHIGAVQNVLTVVPMTLPRAGGAEATSVRLRCPIAPHP